MEKALAGKSPWTEEPGGLRSMGSRRVRHDWATSLSLFPFMRWRRKLQPTPVFLPGESQGRGNLVGCRLWGCTESDTTEAMQQQQQQGVYGVSLIAQMVKIHLSMQVIRFNPWVKKLAWRRKWLPTPVFLPGEFYGQRSPEGYSPWDCKVSDMTEQLTLSLHGISFTLCMKSHTHTHTFSIENLKSLNRGLRL